MEPPSSNNFSSMSHLLPGTIAKLEAYLDSADIESPARATTVGKQEQKWRWRPTTRHIPGLGMMAIMPRAA
jgi:hypothetical protein